MIIYVTIGEIDEYICVYHLLLYMLRMAYSIALCVLHRMCFLLEICRCLDM